jgi:hypothetical protein
MKHILLVAAISSVSAAILKTEDSATLHNHGAHAHVGAVGGLGLCQGDCDNDDHCRGDLYCHKSQVDGAEVIGCLGKTHGKTDYCAECVPGSRCKTQDSATLLDHGAHAHVGAVGGLGLCQGDCDNDDHCRTGLVCHQNDEIDVDVPACFGKTYGLTDYCIPAHARVNECDTNHCADWTCAQWCRCYDASAAMATVYAQNGCIEDGSDSCSCP